MSRQSLAKAHQKIQELAWEPQYHEPYMKYGTDYTFRKAQKKDPLKQILRSYFPMEEEKDNRVFGAMDGAIRGNMFRQVQQRWMEWQKLFLSIIPFPEISAARAMPLAINAVPNPEVHNGLAIQMIDEVRHSTIQMNLKRLYMNHYIDPAGFDITEKGFANCYAGTIGRQAQSGPTSPSILPVLAVGNKAEKAACKQEPYACELKAEDSPEKFIVAVGLWSRPPKSAPPSS